MQRKPRINQVMKHVSEYYNVGIRHLIDSNRRTDVFLIPRYMVYYISRKVGYKFYEISKALNKTGHTTISRGIKRFEKMLEADEALSLHLSRVTFKINLFT